MNQLIRQIIVALLIVVGAVLAPLAVTTDSAIAINPANQAENGLEAAGGGSASDEGLKTAIQTVVNVLLFAIGAVAVVMLIIGGFKYVVSNGNSGQMESAKNTILYSVIGIVVALAAYAIVGFVISAF